MSKARQRGRELLVDLETTAASIIQAALIEAERQGGSLPNIAQRIARRLSDHMADAWGGQQLYVPMDIARRNARIYAEFTGDNHSDLASRYRTSTRHIYDVVSSERARRNPRLPLWDDEDES